MIIRFTPNTLNGALFYEITNSYSLEWIINIYLCCNLWFSKSTPLEDEIYPQGKFAPG